MKKALTFLLSVVLLLPLVGAQPYVTVFQGRLPQGGALHVGSYTLLLTKAANGSPYVILKNGSETLDISPFTFGRKIERGEIKVLLGSYTQDGGFLTVSVKPKLVATIRPEKGESVTVNGTKVEVVRTENGTVEVAVGDVHRTLGVNGSAVVGLIAVEYNGKSVEVYSATPASVPSGKGTYSVFCPYGEIEASGPVDIPVSVSSNSDEPLTLRLSILNLPKGWSAGFFYGGIRVEEITLPTKGSATLTLHIEPTSDGTLTFRVGNVTGKVTVKVPGVSVSLPYRSIETEAGKTLQIPLSFSGTGKVEFKTEEVPKGWSVYLTGGGYRLRAFEVRGSFNAGLTIEVPRNATLGDHRIAFSINGREYRVDVYVYKTYLGQPAELEVGLRDDSGKSVSGWVAVGGNNLTVGTGGTVTFELKPGTYTLRAGAEGCLPAEEKVKLSDGEKKSLTITLKRAEHYFKASLERDVVTAGPGIQPSVKLTVKNLGKSDDAYSVSVEGLPEGWDYVLSQDPQGNSQIGSLRVRSGEEETAYLVLIPPFNVESGEFTVNVTISGTGMNETFPLKVHVENPAALSLNAENPMLSVRTGGTTATTIYIDATGRITNVKFSAQAPSGWNVEVVPQEIPNLGPESHGGVMTYTGPAQVQLRVRVPKSAPAGTYTITVTAAGDQAKGQTVVTVRVTRGSGGAWIGAILLLLAFGVVIWLMRRVGRR